MLFQLFCYRSSKILCAICLFLSCCGLLWANPCTEHHCVGVIDAGSTGSRLYIWQYDVNNHNQPSNLKKIYSNKVSPGIDALLVSNKEEDMSLTNHYNYYLDNLMDKNYSVSIPIYFYATAGMRLLPQAEQDTVFYYIKNWFAEHPNWQLIDIRTITGQEEAVYGWLSVNYVNSRLEATKNDFKPALMGVMDMGGASVQVAFPLSELNQNQNLINKNDLVELDIYNNHVTLFAHSFLGLGKTEIFHQMQNTPECFPNQYLLANEKVGLGDINKCMTNIDQHMEQIHHVANIVQPAMDSRSNYEWFVMGSTSYLASSPLFDFKQYFSNDLLFTQASTKACQPTWSELSQLFPNDAYLFSYCLDAAYNYALIVNEYGFDPEQLIQFEEQNKNQDWSAGVILATKN